MRLQEAFLRISSAPAAAAPFPVSLVMGGVTEPLSVFLAAHLQDRLPGRRACVGKSRFGDLHGSLHRALATPETPVVFLLEWSDLDSRLGLRDAGKWGRNIVPDILACAEARLDDLASILENAPLAAPIILAPPTLPLPPVSLSSPGRRSPLEAGLRFRLEGFLHRLSRLDPVRILSTDVLDIAGPPYSRRDARNLLQAGSAYSLPFASAFAQALSRLLVPPTPAKGIITDLDNTLWAGIVGELGHDAVDWTLERHAAQHAIYQRFLQSMAEDGALVGVASKNDPAVVAAAFRRPDLLLDPRSVFPLEVSWQPKSEAVARILAAWNIGPESVVFIDDSPIEVAEVKAAFPAMECRVFPAADPDAFLALLDELAAMFGKPGRSEEDSLRLDSIRSAAAFTPGSGLGAHEQILRSAEGVLCVIPLGPCPDPRALELINKTNQFNLNGRRLAEPEWIAFFKDPQSRAWIASYEDKFGRLGKVSVLAGRRLQSAFHATVWVMSCRAFSRRIEHAFLDSIFHSEQVDSIEFDFVATERNGPVREFLECFLPSPLGPPFSLTRRRFDQVKPAIYLRVE